MPKTNTYGHVCTVARALEVIGEKWSLLIVRDLLYGPRRFTDLHRSLNNITPKWLTLRLRELEAAGLVERDHEEGRREVWYHLTPMGRGLGPVIGALNVWGMDYAMRPLEPDDRVDPAQLLAALTGYCITRRVRLPRDRRWLVDFERMGAYTIEYAGGRWSWHKGEPEGDPDLALRASPEAWVSFVLTPREQRREAAGALAMEGSEEARQEFLGAFGG